MKKRKGKKLFSALIIVASIILLIGVVYACTHINSIKGDRGTIWTTKNSCGTENHRMGRLDTGAKVYINGRGFNANTYAWTIKGLYGKSSCDAGVVVASGNKVVDASGKFCFEAYTIKKDDCGIYNVNFGKKNTNYRVKKLDNPPVVCGDSVCEGTETCSNCVSDCGECAPFCGDNLCDDATETCSNCATDCGACPALPDYCNIGIKGAGNVYGKVFSNEIGGENLSNFPVDLYCMHEGQRNKLTGNVKTNEDGSYAVNFDSTLCGVGDALEVRGYREAFGGINTGVMGEEGTCLNLISMPI